jgi:Uma2 family endonuclease
MITTALEAPAPPNGEARYEFVDGHYEELPMSYREDGIASELGARLTMFARAQGLGRGRIGTLFRMSPAGRQERRPDVAFVSYGRWPRQHALGGTNAAPVCPELAVEVVSPTDAVHDLLAKVHEYFAVGVLLVWVVLPNVRQVYVYESPTAVRILTEADELDGGTVLPGFRLPVRELFEDEEPQAPAGPATPA